MQAFFFISTMLCLEQRELVTGSYLFYVFS